MLSDISSAKCAYGQIAGRAGAHLRQLAGGGGIPHDSEQSGSRRGGGPSRLGGLWRNRQGSADVA